MRQHQTPGREQLRPWWCHQPTTPGAVSDQPIQLRQRTAEAETNDAAEPWQQRLKRLPRQRAGQRLKLTPAAGQEGLIERRDLPPADSAITALQSQQPAATVAQHPGSRAKGLSQRKPERSDLQLEVHDFINKA
jgi:hypothetical protein